jgi:hypothetical protein
VPRFWVFSVKNISEGADDQLPRRKPGKVTVTSEADQGPVTSVSTAASGGNGRHVRRSPSLLTASLLAGGGTFLASIRG